MAEPNGYPQAVVPATDPESCDGLALAALAAGRIRVDADKGEIYKQNGERAERVDRTAYGRVVVRTSPVKKAMAHRIIWLATYGFIPDGLEVNHVNRIKWDNRLTNLELVTSAGNQAHWRGGDYISVEAGFTLDELLSRIALASDEDEDETPAPISTNFLQSVGPRRWKGVRQRQMRDRPLDPPMLV